MAVVVSSNSGKWHYAIKHFICDAAADVRDLPIDGVWPGSTAYVVDTCESYIFNSNKEWIKITNNSSGSGGGLAATIQVGNVTIGQPGSDVTITNSGTTSAAVFDFSIPRGEPFQIKEVYDSIAAMEADYNNPDLNVGDLVAIVSDPSDPDNASLYVKGDTQFEFFMDLSGAQGIQGPAGPQGEKGDAFTYSDFSPAQLESLTGPRGPQGPEGNGISNITQNPNGTLTITMDDGDQYTVDVEAFIDKMDKTNPTGTGYFSLNRKAGTATGDYSFTEGYSTTASGSGSHAGGLYTTASGEFSHAEGASTTASGVCSHSEGYSTTANHAYQHVFGQYNIEDPSSAVADARGNYVEIVGNGTAPSARSNARTLDWDGNETLAGNLTIGGTPTNNDHAATKGYVDDAVASATELPTPATGDIGKIVSVISDGDEGAEYGLETIPSELPTVSYSDNTRVLAVKSGKWIAGPKLVHPSSGNLGQFLYIKDATQIGAKTLPAIRSLVATRSGNTLILSDPDELSACITAVSSGGIVTVKDGSGVWSISGYSSNAIDIFRIVPEDATHVTIEFATINATSNTITSYTMSAS